MNKLILLVTFIIAELKNRIAGVILSVSFLAKPTVIIFFCGYNEYHGNYLFFLF